MTPTAVFSALKGYDTQLGQRQADWLENPQIQKVPFHLVDGAFLRQQSLADLLQGQRAVERLMSIASEAQLETLAPLHQLFQTILNDPSFLQSQSTDSLRTAKHLLVERKMAAFDQLHYLGSESAKETLQAIDQMIEKINNIAAQQLAKSPQRGIDAAAAARVTVPEDDRNAFPVPMQSKEKMRALEASRMNYAPHLAALMGLELKEDTSRLQRAARLALSDQNFHLAVIGNSDYIHGIPYGVQDRIQWAQEYAHSQNKHLKEDVIHSLELAAQSMRSDGFKLLVENLMVDN